MDPDRAVADDVESNTSAPAQGTVPTENENRPINVSQRGGEEEFVVLVEKACKAEELAKEKRKVEIESRDSRKRQLMLVMLDQVNRNVHSVVDVLGECRANERACFKCGSQDHFIRDCPEMVEKEKFQSARLGSTTRGRPQRIHLESRLQDLRVKCLRGLMPFALLKRHHPLMRLRSTEFLIKVSNPLGKYVLVDKECRGCPLMIRETELRIESVLIACEYPDVFLEELSGLPPVREIEFGIELAPGTTPISIAPYRMAPIELKELKAQLQELTNKCFARSSYSL
ncbi:gag protease polyprotein [Gossypium australe]|uniref:Gag protease polyprotein n=1 Tax=Gossypium australe TaxID=47621 RepID=A0A5B6UWB5_9ROSI|nr:gag protease polyprotein [Gossypium australe]